MFQYWTNDWLTRGILSEEFPCLFALSTNPRAKVESWDDTWNPTLAGPLSDQRVEEFMIMQQSLVHKKPQRGVRDGWEWIRAQFSVIGAYKRLYEGQYEESRSILKACRFLWRQKVPIKVRFFGWLLFLRRLMTRVIYKHSYLETATSCTLCSDGEEDCAIEPTHLSKGKHNLRDILLGLNSEDWWQEEGGGCSHIRGALGNMVASE